jgi:hypothetical protein
MAVQLITDKILPVVDLCVRNIKSGRVELDKPVVKGHLHRNNLGARIGCAAFLARLIENHIIAVSDTVAKLVSSLGKYPFGPMGIGHGEGNVVINVVVAVHIGPLDGFSDHGAGPGAAAGIGDGVFQYAGRHGHGHRADREHAHKQNGGQ